MFARSIADAGREHCGDWAGSPQPLSPHRRVTGSYRDAEGVLKEVQHVTDGEEAPGCKTRSG